MATWHDWNLGRPLAAPLEQCAQLGVDPATVHELAAKVEPRADATRIGSLAQLERQLRPEGVRPAPRQLPRPSTNAAVSLISLTSVTGVTGTSSNRSGPRQDPNTP
jgi:hypothetical protein